VKEMNHAEDGDIIAIHSFDNQLLGYGHYSNHSQIVCRIFEFVENPTEIDKNYWLNKFQKAVEYRKQVIDYKECTGYRLINAAGDGLPGMIVDIYANVAVVQLRTAGSQRIQNELISFLKNTIGVSSIYIQEEENNKGFWIGETKEMVEFQEYSLRFIAPLATGQKTGFFLDQRENRQLLKHYAKSRKVLNTFAYSGAFGLYAQAGNASEVVSVDSSEPALEVCRRHISMNFPNLSNHTVLKADCFDYLRDMPKNYYDLIVLDPPAFTKHISTVQKAARGYKDINLQALSKIAKGGILFTFSCSQHIDKVLFRQIIFAAAADSGRNVRVLHQLSQPADHPFSIYHPEGEYLKGLVLFVE